MLSSAAICRCGRPLDLGGRQSHHLGGGQCSDLIGAQGIDRGGTQARTAAVLSWPMSVVSMAAACAVFKAAAWVGQIADLSRAQGRDLGRCQPVTAWVVSARIFVVLNCAMSVVSIAAAWALLSAATWAEVRSRCVGAFQRCNLGGGQADLGGRQRGNLCGVQGCDLIGTRGHSLLLSTGRGPGGRHRGDVGGLDGRGLCGVQHGSLGPRSSQPGRCFPVRPLVPWSGA